VPPVPLLVERAQDVGAAAGQFANKSVTGKP